MKSVLPKQLKLSHITYNLQNTVGREGWKVCVCGGGGGEGGGGGGGED